MFQKNNFLIYIRKNYLKLKVTCLKYIKKIKNFFNLLYNNLYKIYIKIMQYKVFIKKNKSIKCNLTIKHNRSIKPIWLILPVLSLLVCLNFSAFFSFNLFNLQNYDKYLNYLANVIDNLGKLLNAQSVSCSTEELSLNKKPLNDFTSEENKKIIIGVVVGLLGVGLIITIYNNPELPGQYWRAIKNFFSRGQDQDKKNPKNNVDENKSDEDGPGSDGSGGGGSGGGGSGGGGYNNDNVINNELNVSSVFGYEAVDDPEEMFLCDQSIVNNDAISENLEINHIEPVINDIQVNQDNILQPLNQFVDNSRVIEEVASSKVEKITKNPNIIENTNIENGELSTSNNGLIKELDLHNVNKVVEDLTEQVNRKEIEEIKLNKNLKSGVSENSDITSKTIKELPSNDQLEKVVNNPSITENTNIKNDQLSTSNNGVVKELNSQNVNEIVEDLTEQLNKKENKDTISHKNLELATNHSADVNPKTIENLSNNSELNGVIKEHPWITNLREYLLGHEEGSPIDIVYDTTIAQMLEFFYAINELMPLAIFINIVLVFGVWFRDSQAFFLLSQNTIELLIKIMVEKKFIFFDYFQNIEKVEPQDWKFKDVTSEGLGFNSLKVKGLKINGFDYTGIDDELSLNNIELGGISLGAIYYDNMGFDSLEIEGLHFRSFSFDLKALNNDLINSKYKLTYMQYASIIALGAAIKCICSFSTSYGIYSNIKYGNPKRPSNRGYETVLNQHFQRQLCKHKLKIDSTRLFMNPELLTTVNERRERYEYVSLVEETLRVEVSEMSEYVNTLDPEIPEQAAEISRLEKYMYEKNKFIVKFNIEKTRFFNEFNKEKNPKNNKNVDTKKEKQKKSSNRPTEIKLESSQNNRINWESSERGFIEDSDPFHTKNRFIEADIETHLPIRKLPPHQRQWTIEHQELENPKNKQVQQEEKKEEIQQEEKKEEIQQETKPSIKDNGKKRSKKNKKK